MSAAPHLKIRRKESRLVETEHLDAVGPQKIVLIPRAEVFVLLDHLSDGQFAEWEWIICAEHYLVLKKDVGVGQMGTVSFLLYLVSLWCFCSMAQSASATDPKYSGSIPRLG